MPVTTFDADHARHTGLRWRGWWDSKGRLQQPWEARTWATWRPDECPDVEDLLWADAPWHEPVSHFGIDTEATAEWHALWDAPVRTTVGGMSAGNVWGGTPWQDVTGQPLCTVWETGEAKGADLMPWTWKKFLVPLPKVVRRYDDPTGRQDNQWIGFDRDRQLMWECGAMRPRVGAGPNEWVARTVVAWDLTRPWDATPKGVTASNLPLVAGIARPQEYARCHIDHAMWFVADRYSAREVRWPARGTDGTFWDCPLVAGMRLVLRHDWMPAKPLTAQQRTFVNAAKQYGFIVSDRTHPDHGSKVRDCMDPRVVIPDLGIWHHDLLILEQAA
jgi:hypothetical protein